MFKKIFIIFQNFFKTSSFSELSEIFIVPLILTILSYIINGKIDNIPTYLNNFSITIITITSLLVAFGVASLTMLVTSSSKTINDARNHETNRKDRKKQKVSYYKLLIIRISFSLVYLIIILLTSIFISFSSDILSYNIVVYLELYLIIIGVFLQMIVIISLYFLFSKEEK